MNRKYLVRKVLGALIPTVVFTQDYAWASLNSHLGIAFLVIWALMVWHVLKYKTKPEIWHRFFRNAEIGAFLLPIAALIMTFSLGAVGMEAAGGDEFAEAGVAIGVAAGGFMAVAIAFIFGLFGGIILHLIANRFEKKATNK